MLRGKHINQRETAKRRRRRIAKVAFRCLGVVLCAALIGGGALALAANMGKSGLVRGFDVSAPAGIEASEGGKTVFANGEKYVQKPGMTSILLLGHDGRQNDRLNGQTDFIMVVALDTETGQIRLISVPRDTMAHVKRYNDKSDEYYDTQLLQVAAAFAYGSDFDHSAKNACDAVSALLCNIPLHYYYVLDVNGVGALADAVDGVEVVSLEDVAKTDMKEGQTYDLKGELARQYVTERDTAVDGSAFDRLDRQRQFVDAYLHKLVEVAKGDPAVLLATYDALASYSTTNIGVAEFTYLASVFLAHGIDDLRMYSLAGEYVHNDETGYAEFYLDEDSAFQAVLDIYYEPA